MEQVKNLHDSDVKRIQNEIKGFFQQGKKVKIYRNGTHSMRPFNFSKETAVDASTLTRIIEVNTAENYVLVEPNVPMNTLVDATLKFGLAPPVVTEFPAITVGGAVQGAAAESGTLKYGLFHSCCLEFEMVLGNGDYITASPTENSDLFWGTACSYGTIGVMTLIKLRLIPIKNFVHLTYFTARNFDDFIKLMQNKRNDALTFIDGIMLSKNLGVVMVGNFSDKKNLPISTYTKAADEWFYLDAKNIASQYDTFEKLIPTRDYFFRYDRGAFWIGEEFFTFFKIPFNRLTRFLTNPIMSTKVLYRMWHSLTYTLKQSKKLFVQDCIMPEDKISDIYNFEDNELNIYPLWVLPVKNMKLLSKDDRLSPDFLGAEFCFNLGIYGGYKKDDATFIDTNRLLERKVYELGGRKVLYAHAYYAPDEFWRIYDAKWYNHLREKYHANKTFPDIYEKTKVSTPRVRLVGGC